MGEHIHKIYMLEDVLDLYLYDENNRIHIYSNKDVSSLMDMNLKHDLEEDEGIPDESQEVTYTRIKRYQRLVNQ